MMSADNLNGLPLIGTRHVSPRQLLTDVVDRPHRPVIPRPQPLQWASSS